MRLKLSGPDYKDQDPGIALADFRKRVALYEKAYVPLGEYEEKNNMSYVQVSCYGPRFPPETHAKDHVDDRCRAKGRVPSDPRIPVSSDGVLFAELQPLATTNMDYSAW